MNLLFRIRRAKALLFLGKKMISTKEDYAAFMKGSAAAYTPQQVAVKDETVKREAEPDALFCVIPGHRALIETYHFPYDTSLPDRENALAIMAHLTQHTFYCGATKNLLPDDAAEILKNAFDLPYEKALNCRQKAIALTDLLNACGIKALPVCATSDAGGCHFFVSVWLKEECRFLALDPSFHCFFSDETGKDLSIHALRNCILNHRPVTVNGYSIFGTEDFKDYYFSAFVCDLMANLSTWKTNRRSKKELSKVCGAVFDARVPETLDKKV